MGRFEKFFLMQYVRYVSPVGINKRFYKQSEKEPRSNFSNGSHHFESTLLFY